MGHRFPMHCPFDFENKMIKVRLLNIFLPPPFFFKMMEMQLLNFMSDLGSLISERSHI